MADSDRDHHDDTDPDPSNTPGLEPGGGVSPGDTPPASDTMSESRGVPVEHEPVPKKGNQLAVTIVIVGAVVVAAMFLLMAVLRIDL